MSPYVHCLAAAMWFISTLCLQVPTPTGSISQPDRSVFIPPSIQFLLGYAKVVVLPGERL